MVLRQSGKSGNNLQVDKTVTTLFTSTGTYVFDAVKPGSYIMEAAAPNFQTYITKGANCARSTNLNHRYHSRAGQRKTGSDHDRSAPLLQAEKCRNPPNHRYQSGERFAAQWARLGFVGTTFRRSRDRASGKPQHGLLLRFKTLHPAAEHRCPMQDQRP